MSKIVENRHFILFFLLFSLTLTACSHQPDQANQTAQTDDGAGLLGSRLPNTDDELIKTRLAKIQATLKLSPSVMLLENADEAQNSAQNLAVNDARLTAETKDKQSNQPLFSEIFGIYPLRESDFVQQTASCRQSKCYRVEMYNFALNLTTNAVVDTNAQKVLVVTRIPQTQPDIPAHLTELAAHIADNAAKEVTDALGGNAGKAVDG